MYRTDLGALIHQLTGLQTDLFVRRQHAVTVIQFAAYRDAEVCIGTDFSLLAVQLRRRDRNVIGAIDVSRHVVVYLAGGGHR